MLHEAPGYFLWLYAAGDRLYFLKQLDQGSDLWVTDGTAAGTVLLRRFDGYFSGPHAPASAGGRLFFLNKNDGDDEVWTSDGTVAGTRAVTNFPVTDPFGYAQWLKAVGNRVYFVADDGVHGREIWRTDGTAAGTMRLTELGNDSPYLGANPSFLAEVGGIVVFEAVDGLSSSRRLFTTHGTPESTAALEIACGGCELDPYMGLIASEGKVFFLVEKGYNNVELWVTDGTAAGSRRARELCYGCDSTPLRPWKGGVLFVIEQYQDEQIWISDGTPAGTRQFTQLAGTAELEYDLEVEEIGGNAYFFARARTIESPPSLWVRDTAGKTRPVFNFPVPEPTSEPGRLTAMGDHLLFTAWDGGPYSFRLWSSAGTAETTGPVNLPEIPWYDATEMVRAGGLLFFQVGRSYEEHDLWRTDGTSQGTFVVAHLQAQAIMVPYQNALYFFKDRQIWKTNGTTQGTVKTGNLPTELEYVEAAATGPNGIYLKTVTSPYKTEFWFTDGTSAGTRQITNFDSPGVGGGDANFTILGSHVYFSWDFRLWRTDGTLAGTMALEGLPAYTIPTMLLAHQGALYFFTTDFSAVPALRLWRTDDTAAGMVELGLFPPQKTYDLPLDLSPFAGKLFFNVDDGVHGTELWATDGTPAGTALVHDLFPGPRSSKPTHFTVAGGRLFFAAGDDLHGIELWQSDGTAAGTHLVQDIAPQALSSIPDQLTVAGDTLFFTADDGVTGREIWTLPLSGSAACRPSSTRLCLGGGRYAVEAAWRDFQGHRGAGRAASLTADTGYFWFFDPSNVEVILKVLDGRGFNGHVWVYYGALSNVEYSLTVTDTETGLSHRYVNPSGQLASVGDVNAFGPLGASAKAMTTSVASPSPLPLVNRRVVSAAATGVCAPSSTRLCLSGARFAVEIAWKDFAGHTGAGKAVELTGDTGWFWFFDAANVEVVLKVLDGTPLNGHHWVFYGALSNVEYTVTVTDTHTGEIKTYRNPSGRLASVADIGAF